jgi:hypothetical protein
MHRSRIPGHAPAPEDYSRVTNPERFLPLHEAALVLLESLERAYDVRRAEHFDLLPGLMQPFEGARPPVTLTPAAPGASPLGVAFTTFPGLIVRYGHWHARSFPSCGCDACAEDAEEEVARLEELVGRIVAGGFSEELRVPFIRDCRLYEEFPSATPGGAREAGWTTLPRAAARALGARGTGRVTWKPWRPATSEATR